MASKYQSYNIAHLLDELRDTFSNSSFKKC